MKRVSIYLKLLIIFVFFLILVYFVKGQGKTDLADKIITVSSFIFGTFLAFSFSNRTSRLNSIKEALRKQDSKLLEIYFISNELNSKVRDIIHKKIDSFLITQIDYRIEDFDVHLPKEVENFFKFIDSLKIRSDIKKKISYFLEEILEINKEVAYQVENKMAFYEWISLISLQGIILFCLVFYFNTNDLVSVIVLSIISTTIVFLSVILFELDSLIWQEENWVWKPLTNLFIELNLIPYFPAGVFNDRRLNTNQVKKWNNIKKIRIATYYNPYPNMEGKKIKVINL